MILSTESVWEQFSAPLLAFINRRVADPAQAEDLLQEVFLRVHTRMHTLQDQDQIMGWLFQIARNVVIDYYRARRVMVDLQDKIPVEPDEEEDLHQRLAVGLNEAISDLPEKYRQAVWLSEIQGLKQENVAEQLELSLSGAKSRVQRGRKMLRQMLLDCCHFEFDRRGQLMDYYPRQTCCQQCSEKQ